MIALTVTASGQITLVPAIMSHLGIKPGQQVELHLLPDGKVNINARPRKPFKDCIGLLAETTKKVATIEEINEAVSNGWSGES
jgi:antitoxin component of MazEF toxin-antitoxin module